MTKSFDNNWDPYQQLLTAEHNINQLVLAVQHSSQLVEQLSKQLKHQNDIINHLIIQNQQLNQTVGVHRLSLDRLNKDVDQLKNRST